ncbi:MAG: Ig-like domain-containing protein, partial [Candidatus Marinimicrobia bacterium]|nr:Ig-like domain-containing protein [Candidatus Neomarinimicrobiota bacterium]
MFNVIGVPLLNVEGDSIYLDEGECFDQELTEEDLPFNRVTDMSIANDNWDFENFSGMEWNAFESQINTRNGKDYTYKLTLTEPRTIYVTTCDDSTDLDVQIAIFTANCDMSSWILYQDDSNFKIVYPDGTWEEYQFECISGFESIPYVGNMIPRIDLEAGDYYVVVDDREYFIDTDGTIGTWIGYSLLVDSTSISGSLNSIDYYFNQEVFGGDYQSVYEGSGIGLEISDFSVTIEDNGGNATSAEFTSITNLLNNPLLGGEEEIRLNIEYSAPPSGTEIAIISPASVSSVFNVIGVPLLNVEGDSINLVDQVPPTVSFDPDIGDTLVPGIAEIEINFSESIYLAPSGDSPDVLNGMNPESIENFFILSYSDGAEENIDIGAEIDDEFLKVTIQPISLPLIEQRTLLLTINANVLQDNGGNLLNQYNASFQVGDTHSPEIIAQLCSISTSNAYIILSFTEGVYTHINGSGGLDTSDLRRTFDQNLIAGGQATNAKILYLQRPGLSGALEGGEDSIWVYLEITGTPSGFEKITIESKEDEIYDSYGNELVSPNNKTNPITLNRYPWLDEYSLNVNNDYVDLTFSEGVFSAIDNSSPVETGYFEINFNPTNSGHATDAVISLLTNTDDGPLSGGEEPIRVRISISNPPASGAEEIVITPYNAISISNILGNRLSVSDGTTNTISLFDQLDPTITAVNIAPDNIISLTASEDMYNIGSLGINTTDISYEFYKN